jgi:hypothetical protein
LLEICMKMMAKKPADRYQTMDEVAQVLRRWLVDRGYGSAGGSPGASGGFDLSGSGRLSGGHPIARRLTQAVMPVRRREAGELPRAVAEASAALTDTMAGGDRSTTPSIVRRNARGDGLSDSKMREKVLPKAKPLDAAGPSSKPSDESVSLEDVLGNDALAMRGPGRSGEVRTISKRKPKETPSKWVWISIGVAMVAGVILLIIAVWTHMGARPQPKPPGDSEPKAAAAADSGAAHR